MFLTKAFYYIPLLLPAVVKGETAKLVVKRFSESSSVTAHPRTEVVVPAGYKIISGGAYTSTSGSGQLLTALYPKETSRWEARSKDHKVSSPGSVTAVVLAIEDPNDEWEVAVMSASSAKEQHPSQQVPVEHGFRLVGGGAFDKWEGTGNLLTASYPISNNAWMSKGKDHQTPDPAVIETFSIGIRHRESKVMPTCSIKTRESGLAQHPTIDISVSSGKVMVGGGGMITQGGHGNLLTAAYPVDLTKFRVSGKDHGTADPQSAIAFIIECDEEITYENEGEECCSSDGVTCDRDGKLCEYQIFCGRLCDGTWISTN